MANLMHRFLKNQSCFKAISRLTPNLITHQKPCIKNAEFVSVDFDSFPLTNPVLTVAGIKSDEAIRFYPSFPIGYGFNPTAIRDSGLIETVEEKETVIYADSVKKKMNKHKYRKLRKNLGRKS